MLFPSSTFVNLPEFILYQGEILQVQDFTPKGLNSALLFGESAFTSFRSYKGKVLSFPAHKDRLMKTCAYLEFEVLTETWDEIEESVKYLLKIYNNHYYRITFYSQLDGRVEYFIWVKPLSSSLAQSERSRALKVKTNVVKNPLFFQEVKIGQYAQIFRMGRKLRSENPEFDEFLLVGESGEIFEGATSNFFSYAKGEFYFPDFESGIFKGIFVSEFIKYLESKNYPCKITKKLSHEIEQAKEMSFFANSVSGCRIIGNLNNTKLNIDQDAIRILNDFYDERGGHEKIK